MTLKYAKLSNIPYILFDYKVNTLRVYTLNPVAISTLSSIIYLGYVQYHNLLPRYHGASIRSRRRRRSNTHILHLESQLLILARLARVSTFPNTQALIALLVPRFQGKICWRARLAKNHDKILPPCTLRKGPVTIFLGELVRVEVLARVFASYHEEDVVEHEGSWVRRGQRAVHHHGEWSATIGNGITKGDIVGLAIYENLRQAGANEEETKESCCRDKGEEVTVISTANAIIEPDAVMVVTFDAIIAHATMMTTRGSPDITRLAVLDGDFHGSCRRCGRLDHGPVIQRRCQP